MDLDVLIVGAGPTGLALAYDLSRRENTNIRIIDKNAGTATHSKAIALHARTLEILDIMGLGDQFREEGIKISHIHIHFNESNFKLNFTTIDSPYPYILSIPQDVSEKILERNLAVGVEWNTEFVSSENGEYTLSKNGHTETVRPKWVIGCDGAHSYMRQSNNIPFCGSSFANTFHMLDASGDFGLNSSEYHVFLSTTAAPTLAFAMTPTRFRLISLEKENFDQFPIKEIHWETQFKVNSRHVSTLHFKNIFLCGDAAHIHSPVGGQGMNTSIQDGFNLSWKLDLVLKGAATNALLNSYEKERMPVIQGLVKITRAATYNLLFAPRLLREVLYRLIRLSVKIPILNKKVATNGSQITIHYRNSPIVFENKSKWRGPKAGERLPDAELYDGKRVMSLLKNTTKHTLFLMEENHELSSYVQKNYGKWIDVKVIYGDLMKLKYQAEPDSIYLIRPDGYIGYRAEHACFTELKRYLASIFLTTE